jgi:NADP-dependent aldehyde dehydrogenase
VKSHPGHPRTSDATAAVVSAALESAGAPAGSFGLVHGLDAGRALVLDPAIRAVGFTGSVRGGRALFDLAASRSDPIPFYGELGSLNPVVVTPAAAAIRGADIASGLVASFTLGVGQFCTKPGVVFVPEGGGIEKLVADDLASAAGGRLLTDSIHDGFSQGLSAIEGTGRVQLLGSAPAQSGEGFVAPTAYATTVDDLLAARDVLLEECFGPVVLLVSYAGAEQLETAVRALPAALTATVHGSAVDVAEIGPTLALLRDRAGRLIWNGWPTGVAVAWAQHHGGPWPATTASLHTSVGATAIRRFLRPVAYQNMPEAALPAQLRSDNPLGIPRRVNGVVTTNAVPPRSA